MYDNLIFESILHWSMHNLPVTLRPYMHSTASVSEFFNSFDMLKHYISIQNLRLATIPPHYKSQPTVSAAYQQFFLEARNLQRF